MIRINASAASATIARELTQTLQTYFVDKLNTLCQNNSLFTPIEWFRDNGLHGGGIRYVATDDEVFNRASVNMSQVHYDDDAGKALSSATALSTIIHPLNPHAPSMHMHISWTQMRNGKGYWRVMADLNPSIVYDTDTDQFCSTLEKLSGVLYSEAKAQGDKYFTIDALNTTRGVSHFYLEGFNSGNASADQSFVTNFTKGVIDSYITIIKDAILTRTNVSHGDKQLQLMYHTKYLFQVLTLDRGTTSGLLVHDQNDIGILGSIPSHIDVQLLKSWENKVTYPQNLLVNALVNALGDDLICFVDEHIKEKLAMVVRTHYKAFPEALSMQASGNSTPPTVQNHT